MLDKPIGGVIETGARFPPIRAQTSADAAERAEDCCASLLRRSIEPHALRPLLASGRALDNVASERDYWSRLVDGCYRLSDAAAVERASSVQLEPGMFIDTMDKSLNYYASIDKLGSLSMSPLALPGNCHCAAHQSMEGRCERASRTCARMIIDVRRRRWFPPILQPPGDINHRGGVHPS